MTKVHYLTSESVTPGHPDKLCDRISDAVLDACLAQDPLARVACECYATTGVVIVGGEITTMAQFNVEELVRKTICEVGYDSSEAHFDGNNCAIVNLLHTQSPDIAVGVDSGGAGDQGIMFGYATNETEAYLPVTIYYAHRLAEKLYNVRKDGTLPYLLPDGKTQVTAIYEGDKCIGIDTVVISTQHKADVDQKQLHQDIIDHVITPVLGDLLRPETKFHINPTGIFNVGGPKGDCGLTGRKIIIDTYGGIGRHGGGAFSGKDPTKVDRSGAYMARYLAKNIVASGVCDRCEIQLSYAIGVAQPISLYLDCFGTEKVDKEEIIQKIKDNYDLSPKGIIEKLKLREQKYVPVTAFGHFGRDGVSWEGVGSKEIFKNV